MISWLRPKSLPEVKPIVHTVQLRHITTTCGPEISDGNPIEHKAFKHVEEVTLPPSTSVGPNFNRVIVSSESTAGIRAYLPAIALYPDFTIPYNFFLDNSLETRELLKGDLVLPRISEPSERKSSNVNGEMKEANNNTESESVQNQLNACFHSCFPILYVSFTNIGYSSTSLRVATLR